MSTRRGTRHLQRRTHGRVAPVGVALTFAACATAAHLQEARQSAHDMLIELTGRHRRGGISWSWWPAPQAMERVLEIEGAGGPAKWKGLLEFLDEHPDGFLVMAQCRSMPVEETTR